MPSTRHQSPDIVERDKETRAPETKLNMSTALIPRLISVVEIIKREYVKKLNPELAESGCLSGLHQYNELGALEEREEQHEIEQTKEERIKSIAHALQGGNK